MKAGFSLIIVFIGLQLSAQGLFREHKAVVIGLEVTDTSSTTIFWERNNNCLTPFVFNLYKDQQGFNSAKLTIPVCLLDSSLNTLGTLNFPEIVFRDSADLIARNATLYLRLTKSGNHYLPYKLMHMNPAVSENWLFNLESSPDTNFMQIREILLKHREAELLDMQQKCINAKMMLKFFLDSLAEVEKQAVLSRVHPYAENMAKLQLTDSTALENWLNNWHQQYFKDTANNPVLRLRESFFLTIDREGKVRVVEDMRTWVEGNTQKLNGMEELLNVSFVPIIRNDSLLNVKVPIQVEIKLTKTHYEARLKKDKIRIFNIPLYVEHMDIHHPYYSIVKDALSKRDSTLAKHSIDVLEGEITLKVCGQERFNPFAKSLYGIYRKKLLLEFKP